MATGIIAWSVAVLLGLVTIAGCYRRWKWLVDPPENLYMIYSQSLLRKVFGKTGVVIFTYFVGISLVAMGLVELLMMMHATKY